MVGVIRGLWAASAYVFGVLFSGVKFLVFALFCGALFGGAVYFASLHFTAPHSVSRGLLDAIAIVLSLMISYTLVRDKIRDLGRNAGTHGTIRRDRKYPDWPGPVPGIFADEIEPWYTPTNNKAVHFLGSGMALAVFGGVLSHP